MPVSTIPDLLSFRRFNRVTFDLKQKLDQTSIEAVTGLREDVTAATNGDIGGALLINKAITDVDSRNGLYQLAKTRMTLVGETLEGARTTMDGIGTRVLTVINSTSDTGLRTIIREAETSLRTIFSALQVNHANRNLFSGDATDTPPLGDVTQLLNDVRSIVAAGPDVATINTALDTYFEDPAGTFQTTIYQGGSGDGTGVLLSNDERLDFTVKADDPAIRQVMRGLAIIASGDVAPFQKFSPAYNDLFSEGSFQLNNGESGLVVLESEIGIGLQLIQQSQDILESERITLTATYTEIAGRDQFEASTELKFLETQLQTSYILTARISELTLTNFLR